MSSTWGNNIRYALFGESHGTGIGITIDGLPPGIPLDFDALQFEMNRRRPGSADTATPRKESDAFQILSGLFDGKTTGTPLCAFIPNTNTHSKDYEKQKSHMRPGHADYTGNIRYKGFSDYRGGGHFSGRLTAPLVFAGAISKEILRKEQIFIGGHIAQIGRIHDDAFDPIALTADLLENIKHKPFPVINDTAGAAMTQLILKAKEEADSTGGIVEAAAVGLPAGLGTPFFDSVESTLAHLLFSIPAVKGVEFGTGFRLSEMRGSEANDPFYYDRGKVKTATNHNGGILGGITNGMPLILRAAFKPTPSIGKIQKTIDIQNEENTELQIQGRHDPCIVPRAVPVVEAVIAMGILDLLFDHKYINPDKDFTLP